MALGFFDQENIARAKTPPGSVDDLYFELPLKQDDELSIWRIVSSIMGNHHLFPER
jgi:hypothetical protein